MTQGKKGSRAETIDNGSPKIMSYLTLNFISFSFQFAMEFTVHYDNSNQNKTMVVDVPTDAKIDDAKSLCGLAQQTLTLLWSEPAINDSKVILNRTLTVEFSVVPNDT